jgi:two-component system sensor histidine kinase PilS (NtrC family)
MDYALQRPDKDYREKLKWLMFLRVLFSTLLLGSTIVLQVGDSPPPAGPPLRLLYGLIAGIFILSILYALMLSRVKRQTLFAYVQILIDTVIVTVILFVTGSLPSVFSFLYLVVIIYSSILLPIRATIVIAAVCSIQFGIVVDLEYYGLISPFGLQENLQVLGYPWNQVLYKILITMTACFAVAFLSSFLSEQVRRTRTELHYMEDQVKRVEKMAAVGELAAGLAHEIKNPLASLSGSIQMLREDVRFDPDHDRLMQIILREADRLSSLVNNFLLYARPPASKEEAIELDKSLVDTVELFEKDATKNGRIAVTKTIQPGIWVSMDPVHLRQILWNLLLNAAEAIDDQGVIHIEMYEEKGPYACIKVTDNGCGMTTEQLKSIFAPFFTTKPHGTGLGLSIVHNILEAYGSRLSVESETARGTTFTLQFRQIDPPGVLPT